MAKETPLQAVKRLYGSREKLIDKVAGAARLSEDEDSAEATTRLGTVSNKKLLRLADSSKLVTEKYGSRDKLIASISKSLGKEKDQDFQASLQSASTPRLLDMARRAKSS